MSKLPDAYSVNYQALVEHFGERKRLLHASDVAEYLGCDSRTATKLYNIQPGGITRETLAQRLSR